MKNLIVVVNYNQVVEISNFLKELEKFCPKEKIVVVDDGSSDGSPLVAIKLGFATEVHKVNRGVGAAIRTGIAYAKKNNFDAVTIMSSNGKMNPAELTRVTEPVLNGSADYVTGNRFLDQGSSPGLTNWRRMAIPMFSLFASVLLLKWFTDITCGYRCYKLDFIYAGDFDFEQSWLDRYEMEYYLHFWACKKGLRIEQVPVSIRYTHLDKNRLSKIRLKDYWSIIKPLLLLRLGLRR